MAALLLALAGLKHSSRVAAACDDNVAHQLPSESQSDDTMMLDLIDEVGPGGEYISCLETAKRCRTEIWNPTLFDRKRWGAWRAAGAKTLNDSIKEKLWGILTTHKPTALPDGVPEKIEAILEQAEVRTIAMKSDAV